MKPTRTSVPDRGRGPTTASVRAYAKLNLGLRVLHQRPDGYHEIRTVFQTISLADRLEISFTPARATQIEIEGTPEIPDNLIERAAHLVLDGLSIHGHVSFHLKKKIPTGAGLGGGSADAAAVLIALPVLARKALPADKVFVLATQLGSDVPFFLHGGTALGLGRGEELYPLPDLPSARGLLVVPAIHSSTAEAYRDLSPRLTSIPLQNKLGSFQREVWRGGGDGRITADDNDFEEVVFARHPELRQIKAQFLRFGARPAAMTGSGSAIFGIFEKTGQLERAKKLFLNGRQEAETVFPISFLSRAQYRSAWRRALKLHVEGTLWPPQSPSAQNPSAR
jgi:4-diphosphocytidyl-2-C-methyl-D-erythritol kinase